MKAAGCPDDDALFAHVDEPNERSAIDAHLAACSKCRAAVAELRELVSDLREPTRAFPLEEFVHQLNERVVRAEPRRAPRWRRGSVVAGALAAAAMIALVPKLMPPEEGTFTARGEAADASARREVDLSLYVVSRTEDASRTQDASRQATRVDAAISMNAGDHLLVAYGTQAAQAPYHLLCFAVDAKGEVRWLYPAFEDPATDPVSIELSPGKETTPMDTEAIFDDLPRGTTRVFALLTTAPTRVSAVEKLADGGLDAAKLSAVFPGADVRIWTLDVATGGGSP